METEFDDPTGAVDVAGTDGRFLEPLVELASRAEIEAEQERRVLELVDYAWTNSGFYREFWGAAGVTPADITSIADFSERIPLVTKDDIRSYRDRTGDSFGGLLCVPSTQLTSVVTSSGTSGEPELMAEVWDEIPPIPAVCLRDMWQWGLRPGDRVIAASGTFKNYWDTLYSAMGVIPVYVDSWIGNGERLLEIIHRYEVSYVQLVMPLLRELESLEAKYDMRKMLSSLKFAAFAGQPMGDALRRKVTEDWDVRIAMYTSAGDCGLAWEGTDRDGMYLWEDTILPEVIDPLSLRGVDDNEIGELVCTDFDNRVAPYIRFRSGDLVRRTRSTSSLGRNHSRMWVIGRMGDQILVAGKPVVVSEVWRILESLPETSDGLFQIIKHSSTMDRLRIRVGYAPEVTGDPSELETRIVRVLESSLGLEIDLHLMTSDEIFTYCSSVAKFPRVAKQ
ncbi:MULTISPECIES: phenylacetate--CoA ligase family protein [Rhodococcus]|uniref:Phenylacetate--CoA ligase family protein n=1 Tax=Rhodococcus oxybenzonivorans TaxID=1990687 RepID=A0AAE4UZN5_9NOCA|nr:MULTISPECIES: phenylacetate--CoA ligase family protein [Rhodococcus]MDV7240540.1 phenylacetate--CoA ligase family protein [Rhodococcus oxybenzonivorans]MDV7265765.1 phenylacetate--CoA ligase family protein [Rhodococcus oxybenzonivorans]MDV7272813.1 phenylacetate--CoA ligase family protein [Rhodococcus oxybenzonivorans]MDV7333448.1 phenylacetate--CoA ligase family protein [Rhodococcus oxybenzonivorans]MDV7342615.1 phenylacetate--CoA ligase family protein [Rhodococcus oxybenzonivorans]